MKWEELSLHSFVFQMSSVLPNGLIKSLAKLLCNKVKTKGLCSSWSLSLGCSVQETPQLSHPLLGAVSPGGSQLCFPIHCCMPGLSQHLQISELCSLLLKSRTENYLTPFDVRLLIIVYYNLSFSLPFCLLKYWDVQRDSKLDWFLGWDQLPFI